MEIRSFDELCTADVRTLHFGPHGLLMPACLTPESAAEHQQRCVAAADLVAAVPDVVRASFERLRACHSLGVLWYEAFTVASDLAHVVLECALRVRFVEFYGGAVPVVARDGTSLMLTASDFEEVADFVRADRRKGWRLAGGGSAEPFPMSLDPLLRWARRIGLLGGQRTKIVEGVLADLRNSFAHGGFRIGTPVDSARDIRDLAEIVNRLWGHSTPGGRLYPAPTAREAVVVGWRVDGVAGQIRFPAAHLGLIMGGPEGEWQYIVLMAVPSDDSVVFFDSDFDVTSQPADLLWGPGRYVDAEVWWVSASVEPDAVSHLDRVFLVQVSDAARVCLPRSLGHVRAMDLDARGGTWHVVRADCPSDALVHVRHLAAGSSSAADVEPCDCAVEPLARGPWEKVVLDASLDFAAPERRGARVRVPGLFDAGP